MRWKAKPKLQENEHQVVKKFAWRPIRIGNETRWLEMVVVERYYWIGPISGARHWEHVRFID